MHWFDEFKKFVVHEVHEAAFAQVPQPFSQAVQTPFEAKFPAAQVETHWLPWRFKLAAQVTQPDVPA